MTKFKKTSNFFILSLYFFLYLEFRVSVSTISHFSLSLGSGFNKDFSDFFYRYFGSRFKDVAPSSACYPLIKNYRNLRFVSVQERNLILFLKR